MELQEIDYILHIRICLSCLLVYQNMEVPACYALCLMYNAASQLSGIWCIDLCVDLIPLPGFVNTGTRFYVNTQPKQLYTLFSHMYGIS